MPVGGSVWPYWLWHETKRRVERTSGALPRPKPNHPPSMTEDIFDNRRIRIGRITERSNGIKDLYDAQGRRLGEYRPSEDRTYNAQGNPVGFGNQLIRLLNS